jgi:hypothetical protein
MAEITLKGSEYYNDLMKRTDTEPIQTSIYNKKKSGKIYDLGCCKQTTTFQGKEYSYYRLV